MSGAAAAVREEPSVPETGGEPPPLPDDATPEQKDEHWLRHVYQGDRVPQLTLRAVLMGGALGALMSISNLYTIMKVGWSFGVAITACVLSFIIWNAFRTLTGRRLSQMSILENNCMQSTASAAGYSTGTTIATAFGALLILDPAHQHMPWYVVASFTLMTGLMGAFLAVPMKRQMINHEQLPFPSGIAAATTLRSLYSHGVEAIRKAYALVIALVAGGVVGVLNTDEDQFQGLGRFFQWMRAHVFNVHLPDQVPTEGFRKINGKPLAGFGFEPSVLLIGAGMIVGVRVSLSMLAASSLLYFVIGPWLAAQDLATHPAVVSIPLVGGGKLYNPVRWALWGGTSVMVFTSLTSLALQWRTIARSFSVFRRDKPKTAEETGRLNSIEVPGKWVIAGMVPVAIGMMLVQILAFHIGIFPGLVAVGMAFVLSLVGARATGETDTTPVGAMGKVMQLIFAVLSPRNVMHNLASAGIGANSAASASDLLTDLKSGYLLGANPRKQFLAQFIGVFFGTVAIVPAWYLMVPNVDALQKFPLPATNTWVAVARVLSQGLDSLAPSAKWAILIGALVGTLLPVLEKTFPKARPYLPSAMGLGLGWVVTFDNTFSFMIGALIAAGWGLAHKRTRDTYNIPIASGLVAGESMLKALLAMLATAIGLMHW